jgi:sulfatase maturation enzyme AslB (radical SAM superfamily)
MKRLHVEASTFCNSRCPLCPRNLFGYNVKGVWPEVHLTVEKFKTCLEKFPKREFVYFNGHLGDPMMNPDILELASMTECDTMLVTNGSIGSRKTWESFAKIDLRVQFSIDGLEDTNHLYRQDVEWNKIMERVDWFIKSGGHATWKWVPFKHNIHQLEETRELSKRLGFKHFHIQDHARNYGPAINKEGTKITHWILPADGSPEPGPYDIKAGVERYKKDHQNFNVESKKYKIDCLHLRDKDTYINAKGEIAPCCFHGYDMPGRPLVKLEDHYKLMSTWNTTDCNPVCAMSCGKLE